jgi:hypothetical protein
LNLYLSAQQAFAFVDECSAVFSVFPVSPYMPTSISEHARYEKDKGTYEQVREVL